MSTLRVAVGQVIHRVRVGVQAVRVAVGGTTTRVRITQSSIGPRGPGVPTEGTADQVLTKIDATDFNDEWRDPAVASVNGETGVVVLDTDNIDEGSTNLYYTEARVSANTDVTDNTAARHTHANKAVLDATTASFLTADETKLDGIETGAQVNAVDSVNSETGTVVLDTSDIAEVTNLYYTEARVTANATVDANATHAAINPGNPHGVTLADVGGIADAPSDGNQYARKDAAWAVVAAVAPRIDEVLNALSADTAVDFSNADPTFGNLLTLTDDASLDTRIQIGSTSTATGAISIVGMGKGTIQYAEAWPALPGQSDAGWRFDNNASFGGDLYAASNILLNEAGSFGSAALIMGTQSGGIGPIPSIIFDNVEKEFFFNFPANVTEILASGAAILMGSDVVFTGDTFTEDVYINFNGNQNHGTIYFANQGGGAAQWLRYTDTDDWFEMNKGLDVTGPFIRAAGSVVSLHATEPKFVFEHGSGDNELIYDLGNLRFAFDDDLRVVGDFVATGNVAADTMNVVALGDFGTLNAAGITAEVAVFTDILGEYTEHAGVSIDELLLKDGHIDFKPQSDPARVEGRVWYDELLNALTLYPAGSEVTQTLGHEVLATVYNDNVSTIENGDIVALDIGSAIPNAVHLALASDVTAKTVLGVATEQILVGSLGMVTVLGIVNDIDTSLWTRGTLLYLSDTVPGAFTDTIPTSPSYNVVVAAVGVQHATLGNIYVRPTERGNQQGITKFFNGAVLEPITTAVTSDGATITFEVDRDDGDPTLSIIFDEGLVSFPVPDTVSLAPGTDTVPVENFVFVPESTGVLTTNTTGFPSGQYTPMARVLCQSAASLQTDGAFKHHRYQDHLADSDGQGHLNDQNFWIRNQHATWLTGGVPGITIATVPAPDNIHFDMTSGSALQLHVNGFPSMDMGAGDNVYVTNDPITPYKRVTDLNITNIALDSASGSLSGRRYSLVFIASVSSDNTVQILVNLPRGSYGNDADALNDVNSFDDYSLPADFKGTGILIARAVIRHQVAGGGTHTLVQLDDIRGALIGTLAGGPGGGGGGGGTEFTDAAFRILNASEGSKELAFDASGISPATTRTLTVPDADGTIQLDAFNSIWDGVNTEVAVGSDRIAFADSNGIEIGVSMVFGPTVEVGINAAAAISIASLTTSSFVSVGAFMFCSLILEKNVGTGCTIDGLLIKDGGIPEGAVTAHEAAIDHDALTNYVAAEHNTEEAIEIIIDGGGAVITTGIVGDIVAKTDMTITGWTLLADQSGSVAVDVWKDTYANYPPLVGDSIVTPSITTAVKNQTTGLSLTVTKGDIIRFNVNSATSVERVTLALTGVRI